MDAETHEYVLRDHRLAQDQIQMILERRQPNECIADPDYIAPTVLGGSDLPLDDPNGSFQYFRNIRDGLEAALTTGRIPAGKIRRVPDYLAGLIGEFK